MSSIEVVYGSNFKKESLDDQIKQIINIISNNLSNKEFIFHTSTCKLWDESLKNININYITELIMNVQSKNPYFRLTHVNKNSKYINMFPSLCEKNAEYFILTDLNEGVFYSIYITPEKMDVL